MEIAIDGLQADTLIGYLGELLADPSVPLNDLIALQEIYNLVLKENN
jgi:hypothetical protein